MAIRSHLDPCLGVIFMHITGDYLDEQLAGVVKALQARHRDSFDPVLERLTLRSHHVLFHEAYHFWQELRLPFLFRYATLSFRQAFLAFKELSRVSADFHEWSCFLPELERLNLSNHIGFAPSGLIYWGGPEADLPSNVVNAITLTPLDLLECAASIAEFQVTATGDKTDPSTLRRWAKRNPAYLEPFEFASRFLESEALTLRSLLPLINASFYTTEPTRTFVELLARMWGNFVQPSDFSTQFLAQREPCRWPEVFQLWLQQIEYEANPDSDAQILGSPYHRLTLDQWIFGKLSHNGGFLIHPFLGPLARRWREIEEEKPSYSWILDQPAWTDNDIFYECRREYTPPLTIFRFHLGEGLDRTFMWGTGDLSGFTSLKEPEDQEYRGFIADSSTMYGAVRRASGAHFNETQRTCHHSHCPHFESNFCNAYPIVPKVAESCGFPARIERLITLWRNTYGST